MNRIETGEVFLLLSFLNDEWGWGRSQKTGQSGLIPIVIMEDVVSPTPVTVHHTLPKSVGPPIPYLTSP